MAGNVVLLRNWSGFPNKPSTALPALLSGDPARVKAILRDLGIDPGGVRRLSIANFEAEMNVIMYAEEGEMELQVLPKAVRVIVSDRGQGIPDIELAMQPGYSTATPEMRARGFGAGLGLPNIKKNTDRFSIESVPGTGTTLRYAVNLG